MHTYTISPMFFLYHGYVINNVTHNINHIKCFNVDIVEEVNKVDGSQPITISDKPTSPWIRNTWLVQDG